MLPQPDQGPKRYISRMEYPDHLPGFESKEPLNLKRFNDYISALPTERQEIFLKGVVQIEDMAVKGKAEFVDPISPSIHNIVDDMLVQINGDLKNDILPKREIAQKYITDHLKSKLLILPEQEKYFSDYLNQISQLEGFPPISIARMIIELNLHGNTKEVPEPIEFNGINATPLQRRIPISVEKNSISPLPEPDTSDVVGATKYEIDNETPPYLLEYVDKKKQMRGGLSDVYRAWDSKMQKLVYVKKIRVESSQEEGFSNNDELEAKTMARLMHPGIPSIYDFIQEGEDRYMVMQHIKGRRLSEVITDKQSNLSKLDVASYIEQTSSIIDYLADYSQVEGEGSVKTRVAHPLFHLDIKPENVIISPDSKRVTMYDFNLSNWATKDAREEKDIILGTTSYMAPELISDITAFSRKSEIYSLASMSYYLLTGKSPFANFASNEEILKEAAAGRKESLLNENIIKFSLGKNSIKYLDNIIKRGMHLDPNMRYQTAQEFADAFREALLLES